MNKGSWGKQPWRHESNKGEGERGKEVEVIPSDESLLLAESWVKGMSGGTEGEEEEFQDYESRQLRLGLGAKFLPHSHVTATMSMVEKKLRAKIGGKSTTGTKDMKKKRGINHDSRSLEAKKESKEESDEESDEDKSESRAHAFSKKTKTMEESFERTKLGTLLPVSNSENKKKKKRRKKKGNGNLPQT